MEREVSLGKFLLFVVLFCVFLVWFTGKCADRVEAEASTITGDEPLGGFSKAIDDFVKAGGQFYDLHDLEVLSAAMELENGCNSDKCLLYTGSVILNRLNKHWADSIEGVIFQGYGDRPGHQQYASRTVENLYTVSVSDRCRELAAWLLLYGSVDSEVVYQSQYKHLGRNPFPIDTEWFAYE